MTFNQLTSCQLTLWLLDQNFSKYFTHVRLLETFDHLTKMTTCSVDQNFFKFFKDFQSTEKEDFCSTEKNISI